MPSRLLLDQLREIIEVTKGLFEGGEADGGRGLRNRPLGAVLLIFLHLINIVLNLCEPCLL